MRPASKLFYFGMALGFALAFGLLMLAMPYIQKMALKSMPTPAPAAPAAERVDQTLLTEFYQALADENFTAMKTTGEKTFIPGKKLPLSKVALASYEVNSEPPYLVYALYTNNTDDATQRVLLTLDDKDIVVSFMAEEMKVIP